MGENPRGVSRLSAEEFAVLVDQHQRQLHVYLAGLLGGPDAAFDLVQESFYDAWRAAQKGLPPFCFGASENDVRRWLFRVASNNALSVLRHTRLIRFESLDCVADAPAAVEPFDELLVESDAVRAALAQLAPRDVACLLLRVVHGFSSAETGKILNTSSDNVNTWLARAKRRLRAAYIENTRRVREEQTQP
ncbi:MAG TPA: sigma-70 family RNA polymerase sigma factor [Ktedonobacterales bacterium]